LEARAKSLGSGYIEAVSCGNAWLKAVMMRYQEPDAQR